MRTFFYFFYILFFQICQDVNSKVGEEEVEDEVCAREDENDVDHSENNSSDKQIANNGNNDQNTVNQKCFDVEFVDFFKSACRNKFLFFLISRQ